MDLKIAYLKYHPHLAPLITDWLYNQWGHLYPNDTRRSWHEAVLSRLNDNKLPLTLIAFDAEKPVGTASIFIKDMDFYKKYTPWLAAVYVRADKRNSGIGTALVKKIIETAEEMKLHVLYLFTPDKEKFYEKFGWFLIEKTDFSNEKVSVMKRMIWVKG